MQNKILPCPYCGSSSVTSSNGYTRCMVFGCISYHFSPATTAEWQSKKWRSGIEKMIWIMVHSGKLERHLTMLAPDKGQAAVNSSNSVGSAPCG